MHKQCQFIYITFEGLSTTFKASTNVFTGQVCLFLLLVNDDTCTIQTYIQDTFTALSHTCNGFVQSSVSILAAPYHTYKRAGLHKLYFYQQTSSFTKCKHFKSCHLNLGTFEGSFEFVNALLHITYKRAHWL